MKKNKKAVALVVVMWIVLVTSLLSLTLMQIIIPFSKSVSGMENSAKAYYMANAWLEEWMLDLKKEREEEYDFSKRPDERFKVKNKTFDLTGKNPNSSWDSSEMHYTKTIVKHKWDKEPNLWEWDSEFDRDFNQISVWNPIQMDVTFIDPTKLKIYFKVPKINVVHSLEKDDICYISWQLSSEKWFANSSKDNCIKRSSIPNYNQYKAKPSPLNVFSRITEYYISWEKKENINYKQIFNEICSSKCTLKFSIANELIWENINDSTKKINLPYLEWKIVYEYKGIDNRNFYFRYANIKSTWKSSIYTRDLEIKVPQQTTNEAFDFTVFQ